MSDFVRNAVIETRVWILKNIDPVVWKLPSEDSVWEFITTKWKTTNTDTAEKIFNEALRELVA